MIDKWITRKTMKDRRQGMSGQQVSLWSAQICERVLALPQYQQAKEVCLYLPKGNEVDTMPIIEHALRVHKRIAAPRVRGKDMDFVVFDDLQQLKAGAFGISEPTGDDYAIPEQAVLIMPGVAFDEARNRIGYGGGYYDKYLSDHTFAYTLALAYELQIVERLQAERFDKKPDAVVTELRII